MSARASCPSARSRRKKANFRCRPALKRTSSKERTFGDGPITAARVGDGDAVRRQRQRRRRWQKKMQRPPPHDGCEYPNGVLASPDGNSVECSSRDLNPWRLKLYTRTAARYADWKFMQIYADLCAHPSSVNATNVFFTLRWDAACCCYEARRVL